MSNRELNPKEQVCAADSDGHGEVLIIEPREVPLGGLRAMNVRRTLPQRAKSLIGAWCFLDHYGPDDVANTGGMNVPSHPHIGLQTVSWLFSGEIEHRDSAGFHAFVKPGELNLMTAGSGISHSERSTAGTTILHGAQLWVALPKHARVIDKTFEHYAPPLISAANGEWNAQVFLGSILGSTSTVATHTPLLGAEVNMAPGTKLVLDDSLGLNPDFEHGILVDSGAVVVESGLLSQPVAKDDLAFIERGSTSITITAGLDPVRILIIGGTPFGEEIIMWWNFIGDTHEEIAKARADWQAEIGIAGVGDPSDPNIVSRVDMPVGVAGRYGLPTSEPEPPLPAPKLPVARLKPRQ